MSPERPYELAHLGHIELFTPKPDESLHFFVNVLGLTESGRESDSVYLRGWDDYEFHTLKLTAAKQSGLGHLAFRANSPEALERRAKKLESMGRGIGWVDGDMGHGKAYRATDPDGHIFEIYYETRWYEAPPELKPALKNQAMRFPARGCNARRLDHLNLLVLDVAATREFLTDGLHMRNTERIMLDDGTEVHVTPMISTELVFAVRPGDTVTIHGLKAKASPMVAAASITNDATGTTVLGRTGKSMHAGGETTEASGTIKAVLHEPHGAIDGVLLDGGTIIRLPPSEAKKHAAQLTVGQKLFVRGTGTTSPLGKVVLARQIGPDAAKLTDIAMPRMGHDGMMKGHDGMMGHHRPMGAPPAPN